MEVSISAKERFCKDCNVPLRLFHEPYFTDRLKLYDRFYGTLSRWELFLTELEKYPCEQDYFEEYNRIKDMAISDIKKTAAYQRFNEEDMNQYRVTHPNLPNKDIFKASNDGKYFISIDMKKANFSSLRHYDSSIFKDADTWEAFIGRYTDNRHIINSKYIRQVILGNCNPKRHITYEKYLMDQVLTQLLQNDIAPERIVFFSNDEIVLELSGMDKAERYSFASRISALMESMPVPLKAEHFFLHRIMGTDGYCKEILRETAEKKLEFKCLDNYILPFVMRHFLGEPVTDSDRVFWHEGLLAQYIETPKLEADTLYSVDDNS